MNEFQPDEPSITPRPEGGRVSGCPDTPNCVSSESPYAENKIAPLQVGSTPEKAFECLGTIVAGMNRVTIIKADRENIHAEFRTLLGFVDDVEFRMDRENREILMRSASRVGYWDFGANRRRLKEIKKKFERECG
jgi:uncharacterized protein (DUF1499 family)